MRFVVASIYPAASSAPRPAFQANTAAHRRKLACGKTGGMASTGKENGRRLLPENTCNETLTHAYLLRYTRYSVKVFHY